jgi:hypothetical protein
VRFKVQEIAGAKNAEPEPEIPIEPEASDESEPAPVAPPAEPVVASETTESAPSTTDTASWPTVVPPTSEVENAKEVVDVVEDSVVPDSEPTTSQLSQVGEAVIREVLGGQLISEHPVDEQGEK